MNSARPSRPSTSGSCDREKPCQPSAVAVAPNPSAVKSCTPRSSATVRSRKSSRSVIPSATAPPQQWGEGATSSAGLRSKNPNGFSQNETVSAGITGQSSTRVM